MHSRAAADAAGATMRCHPARRATRTLRQAAPLFATQKACTRTVAPPRQSGAKRSTAAVAAASASGAVAGDRASTAAMERNRATVLKFYDAFNSGDTAALAECFADDVVYHDAIYLEPFFGKPAVLAFFEKFGTVDGLQDLKFSIQEVVADGEGCAAAWCVARGRSA